MLSTPHRLSLVAAIITTLTLLDGTSVRADDGLLADLARRVSPPPRGFSLQKVWRNSTGSFAEGAAEIVAYDKDSKRAFVVNGATDGIDVLKIQNGNKIGALDVSDIGSPNSVDARKGLVVVAVEATDKTALGSVVFYDAHSLRRIGSVQVGALPDMITFTPDGKKILVANEGEPNLDYSVDPEGSVSIVDISRGVSRATVRTASFVPYNSAKADLIKSGVRIFGPESTIDEPDDLATVAQDIEPEYITISEDSRTAYATLQENNAIATIDIDSARVTAIRPLGYKDHSRRGNELDASDKDTAINIKNWPVRGLYMPDTIASYKVNGRTYLLTANEGDVREYETFAEEGRIGSLTLDPKKFPDAAVLKDPANLGRLKVTRTLGGTKVTNDDGTTTTEYKELYSFGTRSFSIWTNDNQGKLVQVFDSGSDFERITAALVPNNFNSNNEANNLDDRSDDKGPEPEALTIGEIDGRTYAFIGLERIGGIMTYDVTNPTEPRFIDYTIDRDFAADPIESATESDSGPEGFKFISEADSPFGSPLLLVANEISGTTTAYRIRDDRRHFGDWAAWILELLDLF